MKHLTISSAFSNLSLLETIPEYISLRKALEQEIERCKTWREDYAKLRAEFDEYRERSFRKYFRLFITYYSPLSCSTPIA